MDDDYTTVVRIYSKDDITVANAVEILESGDGPVVKTSGGEITSIVARAR